MKLQLIVLFVVAVALVQAASVGDWNSYKQQYNKQYNSPEEDASHRAIYEQNLKIINEHNKKFKAGQESWEMGVNQFTDLSEKERQSYFGLRP